MIRRSGRSATGAPRTIYPSLGPLAALTIIHLCGVPATGAAEEFDLTAVVREALAASPRVRAAEADVRRAEAAARGARAWPTPTLEVSALQSDERSADVEASLAVNLFEPGRSPGGRMALAEWRRAQAELELARLGVAAEARQAYLELSAARLRLAAQDESVRLAEQFRDAAVRARDIGERPGIDVTRAELELATARQMLAELAAEAEQRRIALAGLLSRDLGDELPIALSLAVVPPEASNEPTEEAVDRHPLVQVARERLAAARSGRGATGAAKLPTLTLSGFREDEENGLRLSLSAPFPDLGRLGGERRAASAEAEAAGHLLEAARTEVRVAWARASAALRAAGARRLSFAGEVLARAERLVELAELGYRSGASSSIEVLDAQRRLAEARLERVAVNLAVALAASDLLTASGAIDPVGSSPSVHALGPPAPSRAVRPAAVAALAEGGER